jgi:hypothetical protein
MKLPFLKDKRPRVAKDKPEEKLINASADDHIDDHAMGELFDACESKNTKQFLDAVAALVMNMFDYEDQDGKS